MKCKTCTGPYPGKETHLYCVDCSRLLEETFKLWKRSTFADSMTFTEFFSKMHPPDANLEQK